VAPKAAVEQPTINLQPLRKIVGFAAWHFVPTDTFCGFIIHSLHLWTSNCNCCFLSTCISLL
jgi:hypothetical protein